MPLLGKVVIIKRNGTDGTEFPLTAPCLFGRKLDCDIRIQLPQVSKEQCRIELNENKELILTNLSSVNPTRVNGDVVQQSERLKHGDLITIIDRSFRFEYPPPPTPKKKRLSTAEKGETVKVLHDQQVRSTPGPAENKKSEHSLDSCLKDGSNLPPTLAQCVEAAQSDASKPPKPSTDGTQSPFFDLYNMVKRDLASKSSRKSTADPSTPLCARVDRDEPENASHANADVPSRNDVTVTPKSEKKKRRSLNAEAADEGACVMLTDCVVAVSRVQDLAVGPHIVPPAAQDTTPKRRSTSVATTPAPLDGTTSHVSQKKNRQSMPQRFSADEVAQEMSGKTPKSPKNRGSAPSLSQSPVATPKGQPASQSPATTPKRQLAPQSPLDPMAADVGQPQMPHTDPGDPKQASRTSPRANAGKRFQVQDELNEFGNMPVLVEKGHVQTSSKRNRQADLPLPLSKRKRVSFGSQLSPELFDKRLPPNSPLRRGATPGRRSMSIFQKPQSLLRRASTIGLMSLRLGKADPENAATSTSPKRASSHKAASPARTPPAKKTPSPKAKTPSPKGTKTPPNTLTPCSATLKTPNSMRRVSNALLKTPGPSGGSLTQTPTVQGRFSVSRVSTPSPLSDPEHSDTAGASVAVVATPKLPLRRSSSMKASARKTPRSALKSALGVMLSRRRSGASRANLKVVSSWADIVKFGQVKIQAEACAKKTVPWTKAGKQAKVTQSQSPIRRLKGEASTGHADSPATVVIGRAHRRETRPVGAAPRFVPNMLLFAKDRKMDEDLTGVAEIFKTPANSKRKSVVSRSSECPETPCGVSVSSVTETSVMNTPEELGEMVVSPMSVASKLGQYNSEAVSRLLRDNQDASLLQQDSPSEMDDSNDISASEIISAVEMPAEDQAEDETSPLARTPLQKLPPPDCLTGVKKLLTTPKQRAEPVEDLRGRILRTPKEPKAPLRESLEGVEELFCTPKQKEACLENEAGLQRLLKTPEENSPDMCAATTRGRLAKTPEDKTEQGANFTGLKQLMQTPKLKGKPVENAFGLTRLMKTPKQKSTPAEDLTGIKDMMKTPKQKSTPVEEDLTGIKDMMKTPKQKSTPVEEDLTGIKDMMKTPKQKSASVEDLTGIQNMMKTPKQKSAPVEEDLMGIQDMMKTPKQKSAPVEEDLTGIQEMKTPKQKSASVEDPKQTEPEAVGNDIESVEATRWMSRSTSDGTAAEPDDLSVSVKTQDSVDTEASAGLTVEDCSEGLENKENICPAVDEKTNAKVAVLNSSGTDVEKEAETTPRTKTGQSDEGKAITSVEESRLEEEEPVQGPPVEPESTAMVGDATPALPVGKSCPAKKTHHGRRPKAAQDTPQSDHAVSAATVGPGRNKQPGNVAMEAAPSLRGRRARVVVAISTAPVQSPVRKSARGRGQKHQTEAAEVPTPSQEPPQGKQDSKCPPAPKPRRGRRDKPDVEAERAAETTTPAELMSAAPPAEAEVKLPAPAAKGRRGQRAKRDSKESPAVPAPQDAQEPNGPEAAGMETAVAEGGGLPFSAEASTQARKGRETRRAAPRSAHVEVSEKQVDSSSAAVESDGPSQASMVKLGRGRRIKPGPAEPQVDLVAEPLPARSSRVARTRAPEPQPDAQPEPSAVISEAGRRAGAPGKNVRAGSRSKQPKSRTLENVLKAEDEPGVECDSTSSAGVTTSRPARAKRAAAVCSAPVLPVKRGRRGAAVTAVELPTPPAVKSNRGRRAAVKPEPISAPEKPAGESGKAEEEVRTAEVAARTADELVMKKGRGKPARNATVSRKDRSVTEAEEPSQVSDAGCEDAGKTSGKVFNWKSDLVSWRDIETVEPTEAEEAVKRKRRAGPAPTATKETSVTESNQPEEPPAKGRRGRAATRGEPEAAQAEAAAQESTSRVRRGKAVSAAPAPTARTTRGRKKEVSVESALKPDAPATRKRAAPVKQEVESGPAEAERDTAKASGSRPARDKGKAARDVLQRAMGAVSETTPRRSNRAQKTPDGEASLKKMRKK